MRVIRHNSAVKVSVTPSDAEIEGADEPSKNEEVSAPCLVDPRDLLSIATTVDD